MKHYIIDGNNLLHKMKDLKSVQKENPQESREKLAHRLDRFFLNKKVKATLHFDGFPQEAIKTSKVKIHYSESKTADDEIRLQIDRTKNPKTLIIVSSDRRIYEYAKVNSAEYLKAEDFVQEMKKLNKKSEEEERIKSIDVKAIKKLFGVDEWLD